MKTKGAFFADAPIVGVDVGGPKKGYHAVAFVGSKIFTFHSLIAGEVVEWCKKQSAITVAVDAPSGWAMTGKSREAERTMFLDDAKINCFSTPSRAAAVGRKFYDWVFCGEALYSALQPYFPLFNGVVRVGRQTIETFPYAVYCAIHHKVMPAKPKAALRRAALAMRGIDATKLPNLDYVDAALCALAAYCLNGHQYACFGNPTEGFIVVPQCTDA